MSFRDFRLQIVIRLVVVTAGIYGTLYYSYIEINYIRIFFIALFTLFFLIELFYFINRSNRDTNNFLQAIIHNDFTVKYPATKKGKTFNDLYNTFNMVNSKFVLASQQEAGEFHYLTTLIQQLDVGVISFDKKGRVQLVNGAFKKLIGKKELINLHSIERISPELHENFEQMESGTSKVLKVTLQGQLYQLNLNVSEFKLFEEEYRLISVQDIKGELDANEMAAWQKLIRVLTHEIMNSVAPITSLSSTLNQMVANSRKSGEPLGDTQLSALHDGLDAIENRSDGLMNFTQAYRSLTRIPLPNIKPTEGKLYFQRIISLFAPTLSETGIQFEHELPKEEFILHLDPNLMELVFINLLKNAKEAVSVDTGKIKLSVSRAVNGTGLKSRLTNGQVSYEIAITDNGSGIKDETAEKIFIPFYTTKDTGSGVGLSVVKQIVHLHQGEISFETELGKGTQFKVVL